MLVNKEFENNNSKSKEKNKNISNSIASNEENMSFKTTKRSYGKKKLEEKLETVVNNIDSDNNSNELTVIEKIKSFIGKIAAMQEEARREDEEQKSETEAITSENVKKDIRKEENKYLVEYYDLPYRYNETVVKILAQTPKKLFVYWDIADGDRQKYINAFGDEFFNKTYPVLLVYNEDKKYIKEVEINDFANSWYIDIEDSKTKYTIQLGRKLRDTSIVNMQKVYDNNIILRTDYLPFADSNTLEAPNDHVLLEEMPEFIVFRDVKTGQEVSKDLRTFKNTLGKQYDVSAFYNEYYKDELSEDMFDMANPSSRVSSSMFK